MSLADALRAQYGRPARSACSVSTTRASMNGEDRAALDAALDGEMTSAAIARAMTEEGHRIGQTTIGRHRRGECSCEPR